MNTGFERKEQLGSSALPNVLLTEFTLDDPDKQSNRSCERSIAGAPGSCLQIPVRICLNSAFRWEIRVEKKMISSEMAQKHLNNGVFCIEEAFCMPDLIRQYFLSAYAIDAPVLVEPGMYPVIETADDYRICF